MKTPEPFNAFSLGIIGSHDFCRRIHAVVVAKKLTTNSFSASPAEAWGVVLANRPGALIIEIGVQHSERTHAWLRNFLAQIRERFGREIYIILALLAPEKLLFAGDVLFQNEDDTVPSGYVDTFVALPPASIPSIPGISEQVTNALSLYSHEVDRRNQGKVPLPSLGTPGWVQSLADPQSRELWMRWLPRYASYTNENPIIIGDTGTGKTNLAYALHLLSGREGEFISITPRDFSSSELVQAELFGAVAGAYTGAVDKWGLVKSAERGTLFIDELQSIDKDLQGKLITFIENKTYRRVGSAERIEADVRFVFASNRSLADMMETDILRHDFAYRLERVQLELMALHRRRLDIPAALGYALAKIRRQRPQALPAYGLNSNAYRMLFSHNWPGNLRQLENSVAQLCEVADMRGSNIIDEQTVTQVFESRLSGAATTTHEVIARAAHRLSNLAMQQSLTSLEAGIERFVEVVRLTALEASGGNLEQASALIDDSKKSMEILASALEAHREIEAIK